MRGQLAVRHRPQGRQVTGRGGPPDDLGLVEHPLYGADRRVCEVTHDGGAVSNG